MTTPHRLLTYRVQAAYYRGSNGDGGDRGRISYRDDGGSIIPVDPIVSPRLAYESLFTGFVPPDPGQAAVVGLDEIVKLDASVRDVADLPPGWHAWRRSKSSPWQRARLTD